MRVALRTGLIAAAFAAAGAASAATDVQLLIHTAPAKGGDILDVGSFALPGGHFAATGGNRAPDVYWTGGPPGTVSYAVVMEAADPRLSGPPVLHWGVVNIPEGVTAIEEDRGDTAPAGAAVIASYKDPAPRAGGPNLAYHIEVFALDRALALQAPTRAALEQALRGHVLASGEIVASN